MHKSSTPDRFAFDIARSGRKLTGTVRLSLAQSCDEVNAGLQPFLQQARQATDYTIQARNAVGVAHARGVANGDTGICLKEPGPRGVMRVYMFDGAGVRSVLASRLAHVETAFAMTVHKVQGSEFAHAALVLPVKPSPVVSRELIYTGITRARDNFTLVTPLASMLAQGIGRQTQRTSGLRDLLGAQLQLGAVAEQPTGRVAA